MFEDGCKYELIHGDCLERMKEIPDGSVDAVVTDPPYGLSFMGKKWDYDVPSVEEWAECLRVLKPGGHLLAFAGTRTQHRMAVRIEDAGFEIRDMIAWVYGSGFPKSLDVSKAIDKAAGAEREVVDSKLGQPGYSMKRNDTDEHSRQTYGKFTDATSECSITAPATDAARQWQGWGTALKPAIEPITVARKPMTGTVAENVLRWGTGGLNVDRCRVFGPDQPSACKGTGWAAQDKKNAEQGFRPTAYYEGQDGVDYKPHDAGRWPANLIHSGEDEVTGLLGDAARFFYCAKASKADRDEGLENSPDRFMAASNQAQAELKRGNVHVGDSGVNTVKVRKNNHPTVKPTDLMRYLCRLVTPPGGVVLDPFLGSGSTGKACAFEGFRFIGIERDEAYFEIATRRVTDAFDGTLALAT